MNEKKESTWKKIYIYIAKQINIWNGKELNEALKLQILKLRDESNACIKRKEKGRTPEEEEGEVCSSCSSSSFDWV